MKCHCGDRWCLTRLEADLDLMLTWSFPLLPLPPLLTLLIPLYSLWELRVPWEEDKAFYLSRGLYVWLKTHVWTENAYILDMSSNFVCILSKVLKTLLLFFWIMSKLIKTIKGKSLHASNADISILKQQDQFSRQPPGMLANKTAVRFTASCKLQRLRYEDPPCSYMTTKCDCWPKQSLILQAL